MEKMTIIQAALCGVVYWLAVGNLPFVGLWSLQRPLVCGMITGLILGHPVQGAVIGATINLVYLGFMSAGGSMPADMGLAGVLGLCDCRRIGHRYRSGTGSSDRYSRNDRLGRTYDL